MSVLAVIPARGGSKGIPHKNIIDINGKKLIEYSIEVGIDAKNRHLIDELVVSTDDSEIAEVSRKAGAAVPFIRPQYLSDDGAKTVDVMIHAYEYYYNKGCIFDVILLLQPTTPLRSVDDIASSLDIFYESKMSSLISCYKEEYICDLVSYHKRGLIAEALNMNHNRGIRRQDCEDVFVRNGAIYITTAEQMINNHRVFDDIPAMYVMPKSRSVNIDCMDDVEMLRWRLSK